MKCLRGCRSRSHQREVPPMIDLLMPLIVGLYIGFIIGVVWEVCHENRD